MPFFPRSQVLRKNTPRQRTVGPKKSHAFGRGSSFQVTRFHCVQVSFPRWFLCLYSVVHEHLFLCGYKLTIRCNLFICVPCLLLIWVVATQICSYFHPYLGRWSNLTSIFLQIGLVQPPTSYDHHCLKLSLTTGKYASPMDPNGMYDHLFGEFVVFSLWMFNLPSCLRAFARSSFVVIAVCRHQGTMRFGALLQ